MSKGKPRERGPEISQRSKAKESKSNSGSFRRVEAAGYVRIRNPSRYQRFRFLILQARIKRLEIRHWQSDNLAKYWVNWGCLQREEREAQVKTSKCRVTGSGYKNLKAGTGSQVGNHDRIGVPGLS